MTFSKKPGHVTTFVLESDVAKFVKETGRARTSDPASNRYNYSQEINNFIRNQIMTRTDIKTQSFSIIKEREEYLRIIESLNNRWKDLHGQTTIKQWLELQGEEDKKAIKEVEEKIQIKKEIKSEFKSSLDGKWDQRIKNFKKSGQKRTFEMDIQWVSNYKHELGSMGMTPEEFIMRKRKDDGGKV